MNTDSTWGHEIRGGQVDCCGDYGSSFEPGSFSVVMGDPDNPFVIDGINQCTGSQEPLTGLFTSYWSSNTAIATVTKGNISPVGPGDTFANASGEVRRVAHSSRMLA